MGASSACNTQPCGEPHGFWNFETYRACNKSSPGELSPKTQLPPTMSGQVRTHILYIGRNYRIGPNTMRGHCKVTDSAPTADVF